VPSNLAVLFLVAAFLLAVLSLGAIIIYSTFASPEIVERMRRPYEELNNAWRKARLAFSQAIRRPGLRTWLAVPGSLLNLAFRFLVYERSSTPGKIDISLVSLMALAAVGCVTDWPDVADRAIQRILDMVSESSGGG